MPAPAGPPAIAVRRLRKVYGRHVAVADLSLDVLSGEVFGFLGANGAGKTTTMKAIVGLVRPTSGEVCLFDRPAQDPAARREVGFLPEHFRFPDWQTGAGLLDYHGRLAGLDAGERGRRVPEVLDLVGLAGRGDERIRGYSKGMTQRIGIAQALIARPRIVLLDEPTSALDPIGRREVRDIIRALREQGVTVFLNSHLLSEVEMVCDRVAIVDRGVVVRAGRMDELAGAVAELRVTVDRVDAALCALLAAHGRVLSADAGTVTLAVPALDAVAPLVAAAVVGAGYRLHALVPVQRSLEDLFVGLVEGGDR